ncbi:MAG TPA: TolC family protein [Gemmatimonadota bacterium]|nr:TolC family protein [Gemmatimonadota bacterium]
MMDRIRITGWAVGLLLMSAGGAAGQAAAGNDEGTRVPLSVEDAIGQALAENEQTRIARATVDRTLGLVREAYADALPTVDGTYQLAHNLQRPVIFFNQGGETQQISIGEDNEHTFGLRLEQTVFDRSLGAAVSAARHGRAASEALYDRALADVALETRENYYAVLLAEATTMVRESAVRLATERVDQVRLFRDVGTRSDFDVLTAEVDLENLRPALIRARNDAELAMNRLKRTVGTPLEEEIELVDTLAFVPVAISLEEAQERALAERADLEAQARTVELNEELVNVERAEAFPTLQLSLDLSRRSSSQDFVPEEHDFSQSTTAAIEVDIPVFDGRRSEGRALQARADHVAAQETYRALERDVRLQVQDTWQTVQATALEVEATRATGERAERAYEIARVRFREGLSTQLELDEAEQTLTEARLNAARALHDHMLAVARLTHAMGSR